MNDKNIKRLSHRMSAVLRHRAGTLGLPMDSAGWMSLDALCRHLGISSSAVAAVVAHNNKSRFQLDAEGGRIRACQGHSLDDMPVTLDALEASWTPWAGERSIWHGTRVEAVDSIARDGIHRGGRTHVHLAEATNSRVGKRANVAVLLEVSAAALRERGHAIFESQNGVILVRHVPAACIVDVVTVTRRSQQRAPALRAAFGL
jgi:putative RNA 2'-phosphotransferase